MRENLKKVLSILKSPGLAASYRWTKCVHGRVVLIGILTMISTGLSLVLTLATKGLIDGAVSSNTHDLWLYGGILVGIILVQRLLRVLNSLLRIKTSAKLQIAMQGMIMEKLLTREYAGMKKYHSGELVNRVFRDVGVVRDGAMNLIPQIVSILISFFGAAAILISMDWRFVILLVAGGILGLILVLLFREPLKKRHKRVREAEGALHSTVQEVLENLRLVKSSISENRMLRRVRGHQDKLCTEQVRNGHFSTAMNNSMGMVFDLSWLFCMLWGCINIFRGNLTYGSLAAMIQLIGRVQGPIASAVDLAGSIYGVIASAERLLELTEMPEEDSTEILTSFDEIRLDDVSFQYDDGIEEVLQHINGTICRGDFMALTGISGGGKTSLFQLLLGIYKPTGGQVLFRSNGKEIQACRGTRGLFAYVPQGNMLFSGTLRENLTMFTDAASEEEILAAVKAACIDDLVKDITLDAVLGERGIGLSEGQAQRVAVARAILSKAPILLLDEATSALDEDTEAKLLQNIAQMRDKTCIIVTHRRAALSICDYQIHMEEGSSRRMETQKQG